MSTNTKSYDIGIVGGGIIGLATAMRLTQEHPRHKVVVLEKEDRVAEHQTGHNSGVIHAGIYYAPGSQKANFCSTGGILLREFCDERGIEYVLGKPKSIMENYEIEWAHKKLIDYGPPPFGHLFRRIVPTSRLIARRDERP